jgi:hypothetical protein
MSAGSRKKRQSVSQTVGGIMFGFEQQVLRTTPPPEELVHHARPDAPLPAGDGSFLTLELPDEVAEPDNPWAGYEDLLEADEVDRAEDDPWADLAAEATGTERPDDGSGVVEATGEGQGKG